MLKSINHVPVEGLSTVSKSAELVFKKILHYLFRR